jgi:hypothetical protein
MGGARTIYWRISNGYKMLVGKPEEKRPFERPRHKWEDNIKTTAKTMMWRNGLDSTGSRLSLVTGCCKHIN